YPGESTTSSIVSVSRRAGPPHFGQVVLTNAACSASGDPVVLKFRSAGSSTGSCSSGTGAMPHCGQWMNGIGVPQARWRETPQSRILKLLLASPKPCFTAYAVLASIASGLFIRLNGPELINSPVSSFAVNGASTGASSGSVEPTNLITRGIGSPYFFENSKSRSSCAGTTPIAPVP